jgi:hypothetical protein
MSSNNTIDPSTLMSLDPSAISSVEPEIVPAGGCYVEDVNGGMCVPQDDCVDPALETAARKTARRPEGPVGQSPINRFSNDTLDQSIDDPDINTRQILSGDPVHKNAGSLATAHRARHALDQVSIIDPNTGERIFFASSEDAANALKDLNFIQENNPGFFDDPDGQEYKEILVVVTEKHEDPVMQMAAAIVLEKADPEQAANSAVTGGLDYKEVKQAANSGEPLFMTASGQSGNGEVPGESNPTPTSGSIEGGVGFVNESNPETTVAGMTMASGSLDITSSPWSMTLPADSPALVAAAQSIVNYDPLDLPDSVALAFGEKLPTLVPLRAGDNHDPLENFVVARATIDLPDGQELTSDHLLNAVARTVIAGDATPNSEIPASRSSVDGSLEDGSLHIVYNPSNPETGNDPELVVYRLPTPSAAITDVGTHVLDAGGQGVISVRPRGGSYLGGHEDSKSSPFAILGGMTYGVNTTALAGDNELLALFAASGFFTSMNNALPGGSVTPDGMRTPTYVIQAAADRGQQANGGNAGNGDSTDDDEGRSHDRHDGDRDEEDTPREEPAPRSAPRSDLKTVADRLRAEGAAASQ